VHSDFITFASGAPGLGPDDFVVLEMDGVEEISRPYRFELDIVTQRSDLDLGVLLQHPATLGLKQAETTSDGASGYVTEKRTGVLASFEETGFQNHWYQYRAVLVSPLWRLSQSFQSRIFLAKDVRAILDEILKGADLTTNDYTILPAGRTLPTREYVVQYQETDLDFVQRWLEHEGIFYWAEQSTEDKAVVKFGDSPSHHTDLLHSLPYARKPASKDDSSSFDWTEAGSVEEWTCRQTRVPQTVILRDYNWKTPTASLEVSQTVAASGLGTRYEYNNNYKDAAEGGELAKIRAQEILCREREFLGKGTSRRFCAGGVFELKEHYRRDWNSKYLLTRVRHKGSQDVALATRAIRRSTYGNEFVAVPYDPKKPYRPPRLTSWPSVKGVMSARVDGAGAADSRNLDDDGLYRVRLPLDRSDRAGGEASCAVRMAQPSAGPTSKMHFPLHKGAEVLLAHEDGNPDRPVIAAAVPDGESRSPVVKTNQTDNVISTTRGSLIVLTDDDTSPKLLLKSGRNSQIVLSNLFGSPLDTLSTQSWLNSQNAMLNHSIYAGLLAGTTAGGSISWFAGWPKLQMAIRLALAEAQKAMAEEVRNRETTGRMDTAMTVGDGILSGASTLIPLLMNLAFLKRWAKNDAKAKLQDVKGHFSKIQDANESARQKWYSRLSGWLVGKGDSLMDLVGMSLTGGLAQRLLGGGKEAALKARQSRPAFYLFRGGGVLGQGGCTAMSANGNGENFLFSTAEGSIDFGAGVDIFAHADKVINAYGEEGVRLGTRCSSLSLSGTFDIGSVSLQAGGSSLFLEDAIGLVCLTRKDEKKQKSTTIQLTDNGLYAKSEKICLDVAKFSETKNKPKIILEDKKISIQTEEAGVIRIQSPEYVLSVSEKSVNLTHKAGKGSFIFKNGNFLVATQGKVDIQAKDVSIKGKVKLDGDVEVTGTFKHGSAEAQPMAPPPSTPPTVENSPPDPLQSEQQQAESDWHSKFEALLKFWREQEKSE
jgi:type VI secretion system VgrG family protein